MEGNIVSEGEPPTRLLLGEASAVDDGGSSAGYSAVTPLLLFTVFIAICGAFACGSAAGYSSPVESQIMEDLDLSTAQFSLFGSLLTVGALLGSLVSGRISDTIGRRGAMGLSDTFGLVGWILISISQETWSLDLGRFFIGVSLGITVYLAPVYIAEITPKNVRGGLLSLLQLMQSCGIVVMFCVGSVIPWRILVLDKSGRRSLLMISAGAMCFCCFLVGLMFLLRQNDYLENISPYSYIIVLGLWGYSGAYPFGMGAIPFAIMSEIFPMNVKGSAGSLAAVVNAVAIWVVSYTFNFVAEWSYSGAFFVLAGFNAFAVLFTAKFVPETKQRSLEEIQGSLSHVVHALLD